VSDSNIELLTVNILLKLLSLSSNYGYHILCDE